jgi:hypothetical protein
MIPRSLGSEVGRSNIGSNALNLSFSSLLAHAVPVQTAAGLPVFPISCMIAAHAVGMTVLAKQFPPGSAFVDMKNILMSNEARSRCHRPVSPDRQYSRLEGPNGCCGAGIEASKVGVCECVFCDVKSASKSQVRCTRVQNFDMTASWSYAHLDDCGCGGASQQRTLKLLERAVGIEPTSEAWKASVLPLYDARSNYQHDYTDVRQNSGQDYEVACCAAGLRQSLKSSESNR